VLPKQHRVIEGGDYRIIVRSGERLRTPGAMIHMKITDPRVPARFGFVVNKAVGKAHTRNLMRRRYRSIAQELVHGGLAGVDVVIRVNPSSVSLRFEELHTSTASALNNRLRREEEKS
jgi:ribonuclease P protein component